MKARVFPERIGLVEDLLLPIGEGLTRVDAILSSPLGLTVICIEPGDGVVSGQLTDPEWVWKKRLHRHSLPNPVHRAHFQARALARFLGLPAAQITTLVVFPGAVQFANPETVPIGVLQGSLPAIPLAHPLATWSTADHASAWAKLRPLTRAHQRQMSRLSYQLQRQYRK